MCHLLWKLPELSAFVTPDNFLQYKVMPFGVRVLSFSRWVPMVSIIRFVICYYRHQMVYSNHREGGTSTCFGAVQYFDVYLSSASVPITVYTDHNPLVFIDRMRTSNQRIMRWSLILQPYSLKIVHIKGIDNVIADALSRVWSM